MLYNSLSPLVSKEAKKILNNPKEAKRAMDITRKYSSKPSFSSSPTKDCKPSSAKTNKVF